MAYAEEAKKESRLMRLWNKLRPGAEDEEVYEEDEEEFEEAPKPRKAVKKDIVVAPARKAPPKAAQASLELRPRKGAVPAAFRHAAFRA